MAEKTIQEIPFPLREMFEKGVAAIQKNNLDYAVTLFMTVLRQEPGCFPCREALRAAQFKRAGSKSSFFKKFVGSASSLTKGKLAMRSDPREALVVAEEILNDDPSNKEAHALLAEGALLLNFPKTAVLSLEVAFKANPGDRRLAENLADTLQRLGQPQRAEKIYRDLLSSTPNDPALNEKLKNSLARRTMAEGGYQQLENGQGSFRDILRDKQAAEILEQEQRTVKDEDVADSLIIAAKKRLVQEPGNLRTLRQIAELYHQKKDFDQAIEWYQQILTTSELPDPHIAKAIVEAHIGKFDLAKAALDPSGADYELQVTALEQTRREFLVADARKRAEQHPSDLQIRFELGQLFFESGKMGEAIAELQKAQSNPNKRFAAISLLGQCFAKRGMLDLAAKKFHEGLREKQVFDEETKDLRYQLGCVLERMNKKEESIEQFKMIYEQDVLYRDVMIKVDTHYAASST